MRIAIEQQRALRRERGDCANEACDRCGRILGAVRYTQRGEPGEWCSEVCRDGIAPSEAREVRRSRRPRLKLALEASR